jgi:hypothetical protein
MLVGGVGRDAGRVAKQIAASNAGKPARVEAAAAA